MTVLAGSRTDKAYRVATGSQDGVWQDSLTNLLVGKDKFFTAPGEAPRYDYPNPTGARRGIDLVTWLQATDIQYPLPAPPPPFSMDRWPLPRGPQASVELLTWLGTTDIGRLLILGARSFPLIAEMLAKVNPLDQGTQAGQARIAQCNLIAQPPQWWWGRNFDNSAQWGAYIRSLNANITALLYIHLLGHNPREWYFTNPPGQSYMIGTQHFFIPPEWRLCYAGTTTTSSLTTALPMASGTVTITAQPTIPFTSSGAGSWAAIGTGSSTEIVQITGVSGLTLTINRNADSQATDPTSTFNSPVSPNFTGVAHASNSIIRVIVPTVGEADDLAINTTVNCPTSSRYANAAWPDGSSATALTFSAFFAKLMTQQLTQNSLNQGSALINGFFFDNMADVVWANTSHVATAQNNTADGLTQAQFTTALRSCISGISNAAPEGTILLGNTGGYAGTSDPSQPADTGGYGNVGMSGGIIEGVRYGIGQTSPYTGVPTGGSSSEYGNTGTYADDKITTRRFVTDWAALGTQPAYFMYNGSPVDSTAAGSDTDYQAMRFLLAESCLWDAFLTYDEINATDLPNHSRLAWFDEFTVDTGSSLPNFTGNANGWLGLPTAPPLAVGTGWQRTFVNGIVLVNEDATNPQTFTLPDTYHRILGTQDPVTNNGLGGITSVTLAAQDAVFLLLGPSGSVPIGNNTSYDSELPLPPRPTTDLKTSLSDPLPVLLPTSTQNPFAYLDWPNPVANLRSLIDLRTFLQTTDVQLIGLDQFFGAPGEGPVYTSGPPPVGRVPGIDLRTWLVDLLQSTLVAAAQNPFVELDWPVPSSPRFWSDLRTFLQTTDIQLIGQDTFFGAAGQVPPNLDWPTPPKAKFHPYDLRTWLDQLKLNLRAQDSIYGAPGQAPTYQPPPNPTSKAYSSDLRTWLESLSLLLKNQDTFFGAAGQSPANLDWPVPKGKTFPSDLRGFIDLFKVNLAAQDVFFGAPGQSPANLDWPVPKGKAFPSDLRTFLDVFKVLLTAQDSFFGAPGQSPANLDWPVPKSKAFPSDLRTWLDVFKLLLTAQDTFFGAPGQAPANLDWPVPKGKAYPSDLRTFTDALKQLLSGQDVFFRAPGDAPAYDWPNPSTGRPYPSDLRTFLDVLKLNLQAQDTFFGASGQVPANLDWPVPKTAERSISLRSWLVDLLTTIFTTPPPPPFFITDWPVPKGAQYPTSLRTYLDLLKLLLANRDQFFWAPGEGPNYDYPNPRGKAFPSDLRTFLAQLSAELFGKDTFFGASGQGLANLDWPVPKGAVPLSELRTFISSLKQDLIGQDSFYGAPGEAPPNTDWPVPKGAQFPIDLRVWLVNLLQRELAGQDTFFGAAGQSVANLDWPVPKGKAFPSDLRTFVDVLKQLLQGQDQFFTAAGDAPTYDWPVPKGRTFPADLRGFLDDLKLNLVGQDRFFGGPGQVPANTDWPVPKGAQRVVDLLSWVLDLQQGTLGLIPPPPFFMTDWPNPTGKPFAFSLRTWLDLFKLLLQGKDSFYGAPGQVPTYMPGPNPSAKAASFDLRTWLVDLLQGTLGAIFPFANLDWPNPASPRYASDLRTFIAQLSEALNGQDQFFGAPGQGLANLDWPVPKGRAFPSDLRTFLDVLKLNLRNQDTFFGAAGQVPANLDWPVPKGRPFSIDLRTWLANELEQVLAAQDTIYGAPGQAPTYEPPLPPIGKPYPSDLRTWLINLVEQELANQDSFYGAPGQAPENTDWPVPKGRPHPIDLRIWLDMLKLNLRGKDQFFGAPGQVVPNTDWPVPKGRPPVILRTWLDTLKLLLVGQDQFFGAPGQVIPNTDWPVPKGAPYPLDTKTWLRTLILTTQLVQGTVGSFDSLVDLATQTDGLADTVAQFDGLVMLGLQVDGLTDTQDQSDGLTDGGTAIDFL